MRVLHLIATNFFGGPERQIVRHCERARRLGFNCTIATFVDGARQNELITKAVDRGIDVKPVFLRSAYDPVVFRKLQALFVECAPSIVCTHGYRSTVLGLPLAGAGRVPLVAWCRGWTKENLKIRAYETLEKAIIRFADRIVAVSQQQKKTLIKWGVPARKIRTIPNAIDPEELVGDAEVPFIDMSQEFGIPAGCKVISTAGRLSPEKGHRYLIEAMAGMLQRRDDVFLLVLGDGVLKNKLKRLASRIGLNGHVAFAGFRKDFYEILRQIDIFVLPSITEGLSNVILEAFAAGKHVVATAVGGNPELVRHMQTGLLVPARRPDRIVGAVDFLMSHPDKSREMAKAARKLLEEEFSVEGQTQKICKIYQEVENKSGR